MCFGCLAGRIRFFLASPSTSRDPSTATRRSLETVLSKSIVTIQTQLYRPLIRAELRALEAAVERYGQFLGQPAGLSSRID